MYASTNPTQEVDDEHDGQRVRARALRELGDLLPVAAPRPTQDPPGRARHLPGEREDRRQVPRIEDRGSADVAEDRLGVPRLARPALDWRDAAVDIDEPAEAFASAQPPVNVALGEVRAEQRDEAALDLCSRGEVDRRLLHALGRLANRGEERRRLTDAQPSRELDAARDSSDAPLCRIDVRVHVRMHRARRRRRRRDRGARPAPRGSGSLPRLAAAAHFHASRQRLASAPRGSGSLPRFECPDPVAKTADAPSRRRHGSIVGGF